MSGEGYCLQYWRRAPPQCFGILFSPPVEARKNAADVTIDHRIRLIESDAQEAEKQVCNAQIVVENANSLYIISPTLWPRILYGEAQIKRYLEGH